MLVKDFEYHTIRLDKASTQMRTIKIWKSQNARSTYVKTPRWKSFSGETTGYRVMKEIEITYRPKR